MEKTILITGSTDGIGLETARTLVAMGHNVLLHGRNPTKLDAGGKVVFGATVDLSDEETGEEVTYQIVGDDEADIKQGRISVSSPIARALIGKEEGDIATVEAPGGTREYEVLKVHYL